MRDKVVQWLHFNKEKSLQFLNQMGYTLKTWKYQSIAIIIAFSKMCEFVATQTSTKCKSVVTQTIYQAPCVNEWKMGKNPKNQIDSIWIENYSN